MQGINWGAAYPRQNALANIGANMAQGYQFAARAQQQRRQEEGQNALAQYAANPTPEALTGLAQHAPEFVIQERARQTAMDTQARQSQIQARAAQGDTEALAQLAGFDLNAFRALSDDQREQVEQQATVLGNAAIDVLNMPSAQRGQAIMAYAQRLNRPEIAQIANLPPQQQEQALRAAVSEAEMTQTLIQNERPRYQVIPQGGMMVNTNDPQATQQFARGGRPASNNGQATAISAADFSRVLQGFGGDAQRAARYTQESNVAVQVNSPSEARMLPSGTRIVLPDGSEGRVP